MSHTFNRSLRIKFKVPKDEVEPKDEVKLKKPRLNLFAQVQMSFKKEANTDFSALCSKLEDNVKAEMDETKLQVCEDCSFVTTSHQRMKSRQLTQLLDFLQKNERKHADFA